MNLRINGKDTEVPELSNAGELLAHLSIPRERVAVVINENVARRAELDNTKIAQGDTIEIITMVGGG